MQNSYCHRGLLSGCRSVLLHVHYQPGCNSIIHVTYALSNYLRHLSLHSVFQGVKEACCKYISEDNVLLLPLDLVGSYEQLEQAASQAFKAFDRRGVDFVVHNAGETCMCSYTLTLHSCTPQKELASPAVGHGLLQYSCWFNNLLSSFLH